MDMTENQVGHRIANSTVVTAFLTGLYAAAFYISGNFTMLSTASMLAVVVALTVPITVLVLLSNLALTSLRKESFAGFLSIFMCGLYLLLALRAPVFQYQIVIEIREQLHGIFWAIAHLLYFLVPAAVVGITFRKNAGKLSVILTAMMIAAIFLGVRAAPGSNFGNASTRIDDPQQKFLNVRLKSKPNIYFLLTDGFSSFSYMHENNINVSAFKGRLASQNFRLYEESFSNYHATTDSMLSTLEQRHHFYNASHKFSEVSRSAREIIGGQNNLLRFLKRNGYETNYIHEGNYLLLHGCTADYCFPDTDPFAGAKKIYKEIAPTILIGRRLKQERQPFDTVGEKIADRIIAGKQSLIPQFQYIHINGPGHASNKLEGGCDEVAELDSYSQRVVGATFQIESIVDSILSLDPDAVIVISGDHGPFITKMCLRNADLSTLAEYRDRVGAVRAIRWPDNYDGQFDQQLATNINLFRYLFASMVDDSEEILSTLEPEDVYILGSNDILKIISDGKFLASPENYTRAELRELYRQNMME